MKDIDHNVNQRPNQPEKEPYNNEELLRRLSEDLARSQEIAQLGNWAWSFNGNADVCSDEFYRILGLRPQIESISHERFLDFVHPEDRSRLASALERLNDEKEPIYRDIRIIRADSAVIFANFRAEVMMDETGRVRRLFGTLQDVTERKRMEEELASIRLEKEHLDALHTVAMTYAHHLLNALSPILGYAELLLRKIDPADSNYIHAKLIVECSTKMAALVKKLKDLEFYEPLKMAGIEILDIEGNGKKDSEK